MTELVRQNSIKKFLITIFASSFIIIFCGCNKVQAEENEVVEYGENYYKIISENQIDDIYIISSEGNISAELGEYLATCKELENTSMIYIPAGEYFIKSGRELALCSNLYIVSENDTHIMDQQTKYSMLRTISADAVSNVTIYGGVWDGNSTGEYIFKFEDCNNIKVIDADIKNSPSHGIYMNTCVGFYMDACDVFDNGGDGLFIRRNSESTIINSIVRNNGGHGIQISQSLLNNNYLEKQNNQISGNAWSGISQTGIMSNMYVCGNVIVANGANPKVTDGGLVGHGVGISENSIALVDDNIIVANSQCGISVFDGSEGNISNNDIRENGRHGIGARKNVKIASVKNEFIDNHYNGILISDDSTAVLYKTNISGSKKYGISIADNAKVVMNKSTVKDSTYTNITATVGNEGKEGSTLELKTENTVASSKAEFGIAILDGSILKVSGLNNKIDSNKYDGIKISDEAQMTVSSKGSLLIAQSGRYGINSYNSSIVLKNTTITQNSNTGFYCDRTSTSITASEISKNKGDGIYLNRSKLNVKNTLTCEKNTLNGINAKNKSILTIKKSSFIKNRKSGINVIGSDVKAIYANNFIGNKKYGISFYDSTINSVKKNTMSDEKAQKEIYVKNSTGNIATFNSPILERTDRKLLTGKISKLTKYTITVSDKEYTGKSDKKGKISQTVSKYKKKTPITITVKDMYKNVITHSA